MKGKKGSGSDEESDAATAEGNPFTTKRKLRKQARERKGFGADE
jgi:hypothetical protein